VIGNRKFGLCLTRKKGQSIVISTTDGQIVMTFFEVTGNWVRMRFSMPDKIRVLRAEVLDRVEQADGVQGAAANDFESNT
jgi:carbon storage regulator CsrA